MNPKEDMESLNQAFEIFNRVSGRLEQSYRALEKKVESLTFELDRKNEDLQKSLAEKERIKGYLHNIVENLATGVIVMDLAGRVTVCNQAAARLIGMSPEEIRQRGPAAALGIQESYPQDAGGLKTLLDTLNSRSYLHREGRLCRTIHVSTTPLHEKEGPMIGGIIHLEDVTKIRRLEQQAERKNRLAAMGEMAAGIAHEIRNPLGGIELYASILQKEIRDDPDAVRLAENIITGVRSLEHILSNLLSYSRPLRPMLRPVVIRELVDGSLTFAAHALRQNGIEWSCLHRDGDARILTDGELLKQVLMNLVLNAVQAMPEGGALRIETSVSEGEAEFRISDTGEGIPNEDLNKIFNPFYSTREKGTGLGLAIVHHIVETLGGRIQVESRLSEGTTFIVNCPCEEEAMEIKPFFVSAGTDRPGISKTLPCSE